MSGQENSKTEWLSTYFDEVTPKEFYRGLFGEGELDQEGSFTKGKYVGIAVEVTKQKNKDGKPKINRYSLTDDLSLIDRLCESENFCLMSPISYCGKRRSADAARGLYAIAIDLDKVREKDGKPVGLIDLWNGHIVRRERIPKPTYIVSSGTGLHLYYVFDRPIALFPNLAKQLQRLKHDLTDLAWNEGIVDIKDSREIQQEGIYQGFRVVGTITKRGTKARAFETGEKVSIDYLNSFVDKNSRVTEYIKSPLSLKKAAELYPDWYERRIVNKEKKGTWHVSRRLYDWWKAEIMKGAKVGHRYYCLMTLAAYAQKCSMYDAKHNPNPVTLEELESDCFEIMDMFEMLTESEDNHFGEDDVLAALEAFDQKWITYPRNSIEYKSGIEIKPQNRRNGQKQEWHLEDIRAKKERMKKRGQRFKAPEGRPSKEDDVRKWRSLNPSGKKADCVRDLGIDRKTVSKYWD